MTNETIMVVMKNMTRIKVNPRAKNVTIEMGATWQMVLEVVQEHGHVPLLETLSPEAVIVSSFAEDMDTRGLIDVELVTAKGEIIHVNDEQRPDLFRALQGGIGNFGIITEITVRLFSSLSLHEFETLNNRGSNISTERNFQFIQAVKSKYDPHNRFHQSFVLANL